MNGSDTDAGDATDTRPAYTERLTVPASWWLVAAFLVVSFWFAFAIALPSPWTHVPGVAAAVAATAALLIFGRLRIRVDASGLTVGSAHLPVTAMASARALSPTYAQVLRGPGADAAARYLLRPYVHRAVHIDLVDAPGRAPYWYVATRRPEQLAAALGRIGCPDTNA